MMKTSRHSLILFRNLLISFVVLSTSLTACAQDQGSEDEGPGFNEQTFNGLEWAQYWPGIDERTNLRHRS